MRKSPLLDLNAFKLNSESHKNKLDASRNLTYEHQLKTDHENKLNFVLSETVLGNRVTWKMENVLILSGMLSTGVTISHHLKSIIGDDFNATCHSIDDGHELFYKDKLVIFTSVEIYYEALTHEIVFQDCEMIFAHRAPSFEKLETLFTIAPGEKVILINDSKISAQEGLESIQSFGFEFENVTLAYPDAIANHLVDPYAFDVAVIFGEQSLAPIGVKIIDLGCRVLDHYSIVKLSILLGLDEQRLSAFINDYSHRAFRFMSLANQQKQMILDINNKLEISYFETVKAMAMAIDAKDQYTGGHCERVMDLALKIGVALNLDDANLKTLKYSSILHDVGKIGIPDSVLNKPDIFTDVEYALIKQHPRIGCDMLQPIAFLKETSLVILDHHERLDGSGYPSGKMGTEIHPLSKILTVVDAYDAMTSARPYRSRPLETCEAFAELQKHSNTQFDAEIVRIFGKILNEMSIL